MLVPGALIGAILGATGIYVYLSRLTHTQLLETVHLWWELLEYPEVRALFDDKPDHVEYLRRLWPSGRTFPFD